MHMLPSDVFSIQSQGQIIYMENHLYGMTMGVIGSSSQVGRDGGGQPCPVELGSDGTG
jgi:hypothetical protein